MLWNKEFTGLVLDGDTIKVAHVKKQGDTLQLVKLDSYSLVENVDKGVSKEAGFDNLGNASAGSKSTDSGDIFGFEEDNSGSEVTGESQQEEDIDFEELEANAKAKEDPELPALDMVDESEGPRSNAILVYNILTDIDNKSVDLGLNIPAGETIFQIIRDTDFNEVKTKDLIEDLESKLESIYGTPKSPDNYAYKIREDGSLVLASVEDQSPLLQITDEARDFYNGKLRIKSIYPDEVALAKLVGANYQLESTKLTALLQFGEDQCRILFMQGKEIWHVPAMVNQGTTSPNFLNTVFSKMLFQLDTGKVPGIDQIIIANNTLGEKAVDFFRQSFPDITVQQFQFNQEKFDDGNREAALVTPFTTAIAAAWSAAMVEGGEADAELSFLPSYVEERQKIFKLQWHGLLLLTLIFLSIPTINYFYQQNAVKIDSLSDELELTTARINQIEPLVQSTNQISQDLTLLTSKLALLDSLSEGSKAWSERLDMLNEGMNSVPNSWFTSMSKTQDGTFIEGYTLYRNRVPVIIDLFAEATLLNVSIEEVREEEIFRFSMIVKQFAEDPSIYSPEKPQSIEQILNN